MTISVKDVRIPVGSPHSQVPKYLQFADRWFSVFEKHATRFAACKARTVLAVSFAAIVLRVSILWFLPVPLPQIHDEFSQLLLADTLAHGRLANPPHPMSLYLETFHILQHPTYASVYPPAQGAVLALGQILGHPWIGVLLSMAAMCGAITWMLQGWFPAPWALLGGLLVVLRFALFSYWINSYWGGTVAGIGGALVLCALPRIIHHRRWPDALLLGLGMAILANSRPFEGFIFCVPVVIYLTYWLFSRERPSFILALRRVLIPLVAILVPTLAFMGCYNRRVTGNAFLFPHVLFVRQYTNRGVFAWQDFRTPLTYSNPEFDYFYNTRLRERYAPSWSNWKRTSWNGLRACWHLFLGIPLSIPFLAFPWILRGRRMHLLLMQLFLSVVGLLLIFVFLPHYAAPLTATVFALLVQAFRHLRKWRIRGRNFGIALSRAIVLLAIANFAYFAWHTARQPYVAPWSSAREQIIRQLEKLRDSSLVIVRYGPEHAVDDEWVYNSADIDHSKIVWAREIPGVDPRPLLEYFHQRTVWLLDADAPGPQLVPFPLPSGVH